MTFESLLVHRCNLGTATSSQNTLGEWEYSWTYAAAETKCRKVPLTYEERLQLGGLFEGAQDALYFVSGVSIDSGDRVKLASQEYLVRDCTMDSSSHHKRAIVTKL
jgi:hypothetical protein